MTFDIESRTRLVYGDGAADRVGRLADTLEYSDVALPLDRFDPALVDELFEKAPSQVSRAGDKLVIKHVYIERRMTPLDVYLRNAAAHGDHQKVRNGLFEYGQAIRELAGANVFPGDLLLDRKSTRLNSSHVSESRMPSSA